MGNYRNNGNGDEEPTSGFAMPDDILWTDQFTDFSVLPSKGYSMLVRAKRHGRWWMLKGLKEQYREDSVYRALLQKEYEITSQLQHPMVVSAISLEEVEGLGLCIVMEWIDGLTLKQWLAQGGHTRKERRRVADMLLEVLTYVHGRQTQHRDLKPSNIMLTHNGQYLKLIDFGLSDTDSHAILKAPAGTEGYMAPDGPSDIYSLGCILRELRTGWSSRMVVRKCCASLDRRYTSVANIQRDLHRCWQWTPWMLLIVCFVIVMTAIYLPPLISRFIAQNTVQGDLQSPHSEEIISFADKHVKDICVAHWDTNGDGELSMGEAAAVRNISDAFVETSITSFDEFRFFSRVILLPEWTSFCGCMALNSIVIPANLTSISGLSFANCSSLKNISVDSVNTVYDSRSDCNAIIETATNKLVVGCKTSNIPDGITAIGNSAFWGRWDMQEMTLPETITTIEKDAFSCCTSLKAITLPASISEIGDRAFVRCDALTSVRCYMETPPAIDKDAFTNRANATLYVPKGCKAAYEAADYWKEFKVIKEF
ncbi:MAG: leucine-rich repeat protein [Prevotella sp.]|nr:leucine-rich repeat protein [Prevotella sp.]